MAVVIVVAVVVFVVVVVKITLRNIAVTKIFSFVFVLPEQNIVRKLL